GGDAGQWRVVSQSAWIGEGLPAVPFIRIDDQTDNQMGPPRWTLRGFTSNLRYSTRSERSLLDRRSEGLHRSHATCAALIPITKSPQWWAMAQDERRAIYARSEHMAIGADYLPAIARRLHHSRDLGEPFDFLTWFEYPPEASTAFEALVARLRSTEEWDHVIREIDIRLVRC
ncbi:chlorite dismutase family protein, partial [Blastomonas sp.]|uniref:chlorite dismutase family protein n=1 Tax=Blastomonas sp. TaxID=1909299 RepID=UPI00359405AC